MGKPKRTTKQSSNSESNKPSASADFKIQKSEPAYPEDYMDLSNEVDRDTFAENVGSHEGEIPESSSVASVPRTEGDHSDSETSSKGYKASAYALLELWKIGINSKIPFQNFWNLRNSRNLKDVFLEL